MGQMMQLKFGGEPIEVYEAKPEGAIKGGIIVVHEIWALNEHTKRIADRYAAQGYWAIAPNLLDMLHLEDKVAELQADLFNPEKRSEAQPNRKSVRS